MLQTWTERTVGGSLLSTLPIALRGNGDPSDSAVQTLRVLSKDTSVAGIARIVLADSTGRDLPPWKPGAHVELRLPGQLVRQYSLCGDADDLTQWTLCVRHDPDGRGGSDYVYRSLEVDDVLVVAGPRNHFELRVADSYAFFAGGIGITPLRPMIEQVQRAKAKWNLTYLGRSRGQMMFADELVRNYPNNVTIFAEDEGDQPAIADLVFHVADGTLVYACGPQRMLDAAVDAAFRAGKSSELFYERFAANSATRPQDTSFDVECTLTGITLHVDANRSILDVVREAGVPVSFSCSEGTCGTCEVPVVSGDIDHRDVVLTDQEQAESASMMVCVSRAKCTKLVLEI